MNYNKCNKLTDKSENKGLKMNKLKTKMTLETTTKTRKDSIRQTPQHLQW